jgi:hypothetical protein
MIFSKTAFIYGHYIDETNYLLPFDEGSGELLAELNSGAYTIDEFIDEIARALNEAGSLDYLTTLDRENRLITISASGNFDLLVSSGSVIGNDCFALAGFTGADLTGASSYESNITSGFEYRPQFDLQDYIDAEDDQEANQVSVNESTSGINVETISYGQLEYFSFNIALANDYEHAKDSPIREDLNGVLNLRNFLKYITKKRQIEFIPDITNYNNYYNILLESTSKSKDGTGYLLKELYADGLVGYYESGILRFRKL